MDLTLPLNHADRHNFLERRNSDNADYDTFGQRQKERQHGKGSGMGGKGTRNPGPYGRAMKGKPMGAAGHWCGRL